MAKQSEQEQKDDKTLQDYIMERLDKPVAIKGGGVLQDPLDGHEMTATEAIAYRMVEKALSGDTRAAAFVMQMENYRRYQDSRKKS